MVNSTLQSIAIDTWVKATWEEILPLAEHPNYSVTERRGGKIQNCQVYQVLQSPWWKKHCCVPKPKMMELLITGSSPPSANHDC
jgi:hypothetical protein